MGDGQWVNIHHVVSTGGVMEQGQGTGLILGRVGRLVIKQ